MALLPQVPRRFTLTDEPRTAVTGADVARPGQQLAAGMQDLAGALIRKSDEWERASEAATLARIGNDARTTALTLAQKANGNIDQFNTEWGAYSQAALATAPQRLRPQIEADLINTGGSQGRQIISNRYTTDMNAFAATIKAEIEAQDDALSAMARAGQAGTPEYAAAQDKMRTLYGELSGNPSFGVTPEMVDLELKRMGSRHQAEAVIGHVEATYREKGLAAAQAEAEKLLTDTTLTLTPAERRQYNALARGQLQTLDAERVAQLKVAKEEATALQERLKADPRLVDDPSVDAQIAKLAQLGGTNEALDLINARARARFLQAYGTLSDADQVGAYERLSGSEGAAARIIKIESGGRADAQNPASSAGGLGQFTDGTWLATITKYRPDLTQGKSREQILAMKFDPTVAYEMTVRHTEENAAGLQAAGITPSDGALYLAHFSGLGGALAVMRADDGASVESVLGYPVVTANPFLKGKTIGWMKQWAAAKMAGVAVGYDPSTDADSVNAMRGEIAADANANLDDLIAGLAAGRPPTLPDLQLLAQQSLIIGDQDFSERLSSFLQSHEGGALLANVPPAEAEAVISSLRSAVAEDGFSLAEQAFITGLQDQAKARAAAVASDPIGQAINEGARPPEPLDFNGEALPTGIAQRAQTAAVAEQKFGLGAVGVFRPEEATMAAGQIMGPNGTNVLTAIGQLDDAHLFATLAQPEIKEAIAGMMRSTDPTTFAQAAGALDQFWRRNPREVGKLFGEDTIDALQDYQATLRYTTPDAIQRELTMRLDPQVQERRRRLANEARTEVRKLTPGEIMNDFDQSWWPGGQPGLPDGLTLETFMADYETLTAKRYAATGDMVVARQQAAQRMMADGVWAASAVNGGRMTLHPPELHFPSQGGSYDWMRGQFVQALKDAGEEPPLSPDEQRLADRGLVNRSARDWTQDYRLVGDSVTDAEIATGAAPTYLIERANSTTGERDMLLDENGTPLRMHFDTDPVIQSQWERMGRMDAERRQAQEIFRAGPEVDPMRSQAPTEPTPPMVPDATATLDGAPLSETPREVIPGIDLGEAGN